MPFEIVRNDITRMAVDAIVNTANPMPVIGMGTDSQIHAKAGPGLLAARQQIGAIAPGSAAITPGFALDAAYVIHTVGPVWQGGSQGEPAVLRSCYDRSLEIALVSGCRSVAFPLISSGNYGFPKDVALGIATSAFRDFLQDHEMQIYLVVFDRESFRISETLYRNIASFIDENYIQEHRLGDYGMPGRGRPRRLIRETGVEAAPMQAPSCAPMQAPSAPKEKRPGKSSLLPSFGRPKLSLTELLEQTDAGFSETLLKLIDKSGKKDSEIYKRANLTKQHFSKIRNNPDYKPTKPTAVALAIALELDLEQTRDLIGRAGFALTKSSKFDVIIMYFIRERNYNLFDINAALFEFDQSLLGG